MLLFSSCTDKTRDNKTEITESTDRSKAKNENGDKFIFSGESEHWEAIFYENFTEKWEQDDKGKWHYIKNGSQELEMIFKGVNYGELGTVKYKFELIIGDGLAVASRTGTLILKDGVHREIFDSGDSINILREDEEAKIEIKWDNKVEKIILKTK